MLLKYDLICSYFHHPFLQIRTSYYQRYRYKANSSTFFQWVRLDTFFVSCVSIVLQKEERKRSPTNESALHSFYDETYDRSGNGGRQEQKSSFMPCVAQSFSFASHPEFLSPLLATFSVEADLESGEGLLPWIPKRYIPKHYSIPL